MSSSLVDSDVPSQEKPTPGESAKTKEESPISELQSVFGSLLLARKAPEEPYEPHKRAVLLKPKWTGSFEILLFPRELRDRIYFHYLHRPRAIDYDNQWRYSRTRGNRYYAFDMFREQTKAFFDLDEEVSSLYRTCKQVYQEALEVFCRYNVITVFSGRTLHGTLRLFPDKPARLMQLLRRAYNEGQYAYVDWHGLYRKILPGEVFAQMVRDAYIFKSYFPMMRQYIAMWLAGEAFFADCENMCFEGATEEQKEDVWYRWLKHWVCVKQLVLPVWLSFEFPSTNYLSNTMTKHEQALNRAYRKLLAETRDLRDSEDVMLEDSKKAWLQELEEEDRKSKMTKAERKLARKARRKGT